MNDSKVTCPACGFSYVHIASVAVNQGGTLTTINSDGMQLRHNVPPAGRGSEVIVSYYCEGGHWFDHRLAFHKGEVERGEAVIDDADLTRSENELWRD